MPAASSPAQPSPAQPQHGAGEQKLIEIQISLKLDFNEKIIDNLGIRTQ